MIKYSEAYRIICDEIKKLNLHIEEVDIINTHNRILAEDITANVDLPPFDSPKMGGSGE